MFLKIFKRNLNFNRFFFASNDLLQSKIVDLKRQKSRLVIPIFFATLLICIAILQNDILFQFIISFFSLVIFILSFSLKNSIYSIIINNNKIDYKRFDLDIKFKNLEGITFYKRIWLFKIQNAFFLFYCFYNYSQPHILNIWIY